MREILRHSLSRTVKRHSSGNKENKKQIGKTTKLTLGFSGALTLNLVMSYFL